MLHFIRDSTKKSLEFLEHIFKKRNNGPDAIYQPWAQRMYVRINIGSRYCGRRDYFQLNSVKQEHAENYTV